MDANTRQTQEGSNRLILIVISIFFPWLSVLLLKGCGVEAVIAFLLTWLFWIPGVVYAIYLIFQDPQSDAPIGTGLNNQLQQQQQQQQYQAPAQSYQHRAEAPAPVHTDTQAPYEAPTEAPAQAPVHTEAQVPIEKPAAVETSHEITEPAPSYPAEKQ